MPFHPVPGSLEKSAWCFDELVRSYPDRAARLEVAKQPCELITALGGALTQSLDNNQVRIGKEHARNEPDDCRAVIQFHIGEKLFDWFFNARTGYRAQYRRHWACGMEFNSQIIGTLRHHLDEKLPDIFPGRELNDEFDDCGVAQISKSFLLSSLNPNLSKIWMCTKRIQLGNEIEEQFPLNVVDEPRIFVEEHRWVALFCEDNFAWLDVKGGFLGANGPYQPKLPIDRSKTLQDKGEA